MIVGRIREREELTWRKQDTVSRTLIRGNFIAICLRNLDQARGMPRDARTRRAGTMNGLIRRDIRGIRGHRAM